MSCKPRSVFYTILVNTLIASFFFVLADIIFYTYIAGVAYPSGSDLLKHLLATVFMAMLYAHLYNTCSYLWAPNSTKAFVFRNHKADPKKDCNATLPKLVNGLIFSGIVSAIFFIASSLMSMMINVILVDLLHGIRGLPPGSTGGSLLLPAQLVVTSVALEYIGKTEDDPAMTPPPVTPSRPR